MRHIDWFVVGDWKKTCKQSAFIMALELSHSFSASAPIFYGMRMRLLVTGEDYAVYAVPKFIGRYTVYSRLKRLVVWRTNRRTFLQWAKAFISNKNGLARVLDPGQKKKPNLAARPGKKAAVGASHMRTTEGTEEMRSRT